MARFIVFLLLIVTALIAVSAFILGGLRRLFGLKKKTAASTLAVQDKVLFNREGVTVLKGESKES